MKNEIFYSAKQLADLLGVTITFLAHLRMVGGGPRFIKFGDSSRSGVRYRKSDVDAWVESRIRRSTSDQRIDEQDVAQLEAAALEIERSRALRKRLEKDYGK